MWETTKGRRLYIRRMPDADDIPIGSVGTIAQILEVLGEREGAGVTEVAEEVDVSKSSVHRYLESLCRVGFVRKAGTDYYLSTRLLKHGTRARSQREFYAVAKPVVEELVDRTNNAVALAVREDAVVYIYKSWHEQEIRNDLRLGQPYDEFHCSAAGKVLLASMSPDQIAEVLDCQGLPQRTANTITDRDELLDELERVRERDTAFDDEEHVTGIRSVATSIRDRSRDETIGAITVYGPAIRLEGDAFWEEVPTTLERASNLIEVNLRYETHEA